MTGDSQLITFAPIVISALSLILAVVSFVLNYRLSLRDKKRGEQLENLQLKLHELQLQREEEAAERRSSSKVEARYVRIGLKGHRIRVSNTGGTTVTNVTCEYDENAGPYAFIQDKEPYERLNLARASMKPSSLPTALPANSWSRRAGSGKMAKNAAGITSSLFSQLAR